jgi:hypothetical protein
MSDPKRLPLWTQARVFWVSLLYGIAEGMGAFCQLAKTEILRAQASRKWDEENDTKAKRRKP